MGKNGFDELVLGNTLDEVISTSMEDHVVS